ncbi:MAG: hypothetical protein JW791_05020 [Nanoarchaeota archaeon]|nr:hypothetical protein [Nanoarchaeota archaeon]
MTESIEKVVDFELGSFEQEEVVTDPFYRAHNESMLTKKFFSGQEKHYFINVLNELRIKAECRREYGLL